MPWKDSLTEGDTVFIRHGLTLYKGTVMRRTAKGALTVRACDRDFCFSPSGFDKRTIVGSLLTLKEPTPEAWEVWERQELMARFQTLVSQCVILPTEELRAVSEDLIERIARVKRASIKLEE